MVAQQRVQRRVEREEGRFDVDTAVERQLQDKHSHHSGRRGSSERQPPASPTFEPPRTARTPLQASTTLRELLGAPMTPFALTRANKAALIIIDAQNTYTRGIMRLEGVEEALTECRELLQMARRAGVLVVHVQHDAGKGTPYDVSDSIGEICPIVKPILGRGGAVGSAAASPGSSASKKEKHRASFSEEFVIVKKQTSSFVGTELQDLLKSRGIQNLLICGFMAHCCVSSTTRDAAHLGYNCVVVANATATRNLPDPTYFSSRKFSLARASAAVTSAAELKRAAMTALGDAFALVVPAARDIPVADEQH